MNYLVIEKLPVRNGYKIHAEIFTEKSWCYDSVKYYDYSFTEKSWCYDSVKYYDYSLREAEKRYRHQFGLVGKHLIKTTF